MIDPRHPRVPDKGDDDAAPGLPAIDGADAEQGIETAIDLDVQDDEASALDDTSAGELAGALEGLIEGEAASALGDDDAPPPLEADPSLAVGESERWTEGSDASEDTPWQEPIVVEPLAAGVDRGEEGFDDLAAETGDALPGLPPASVGDADDDADDALDVSEASTLETPSAEADAGAALPMAAITVRWHGPAREAARALAMCEAGVLVAARGLSCIADGMRPLALPFDAEVSAILVRTEGVLLATDAGEVWSYVVDGAATRLPRPGTDDASLGGLELGAVADVVVARTRGGALFRRQGDAWIGPIVARNVRRIRTTGTDWLAAVVGSASAPELLATKDARTFERLRAPEGEVVLDAARTGDVVAVACASGRLFVSRDAGAHYARIEGVVDADRVWVLEGGVVLAATFHEASDAGRLLRVDDGAAVVWLDVASEATARRLSGPGEHDGDGRVHAIAPQGRRLWVATGVGVFEIETDRS